MSTEAKKEIIIGFDIDTFKWHQTIRSGEPGFRPDEITFEISQDSARQILNGLVYEMEPGYNRIEFRIK